MRANALSICVRPVSPPTHRARRDPFLTGSYGVAYVKAMQTLDGNGHPRVNAYLKHFDAYATETNRMHSDNNITLFDFWGEPMPTDLRAESLRKLPCQAAANDLRPF